MSLHAIVPLLDANGVEIGVRFDGVGKAGFFEILYASIPGNSWNSNRLSKMLERAQAFVDVRTPLADPSLIEDPAGPNGTDPGRPDFFWDGNDLVCRSIILINATWTGEKLVIEWKSTRRNI